MNLTGRLSELALTVGRMAVVLILGLAGAGTLPDVPIGQPLHVGTTAVNNRPGNPVDPHVDCNLASYASDIGAIWAIPQIRHFSDSNVTEAPQIASSGVDDTVAVAGRRNTTPTTRSRH